MSTQVIMPQMGESIAEGTITKWLKTVGDTVKRDEPIFEISTDKVDAEIPSPVAGTLIEIKVNEGQTVAINTVVAVIGEAGEQPATAPPAQAAAPPPAPAAAAAPAPKAQPAPAAAPPPAPPASSATPATAKAEAKPTQPAPIDGSPSGSVQTRPDLSAQRPAAPTAAAPPPSAENPGGTVESIEERIKRRSSPLVRKIAQEHAIDIGEVEGTGIHNRVTKNDILSHLENRKVAAASGTGTGRQATAPAQAPQVGRAEPAEAPAPRPTPQIPITDRDEVVAMTKIRRITAENMILSKRTSAHVTTVFHVDYSNIAKLRTRHKDDFLAKTGVKLTYLPFIFRACIQALREFPQVNASIDGDNIVFHKDIHLGMARATQDLAERARTKRLKPEEIQGGTFTVTNPGVFGSLFGTPIIPQPQVAILGVGTIEKRPVVVEDEHGQDALGIRTVGYLALSFDHRLIDGAEADRFMASVKKTLEKGEFDLG
jgi:2-oxoglutarate dehydrogenase E2 component (dihydrolipoamide succinyltransferase)